MLKDYGLIEDIQELSAYIFGDNNVPYIPYQLDGNWEPFLPVFERQRITFESYCCTVFATLNAIETLYKRLYGEEPNYSERYTAILSGLTGNGGTDPQVPCESVRHDGVVSQSVLPMTGTREAFFNTGSITASTRAKGQDWLNTHDMKHDWVWKGSRPENYIELLRKALQTSPLLVSVSAWQEVDGVYVSEGNVNNHACMLYKIDDEGYPWVYDSYSNSKKKLSKDHNIRRAKRFHLQKKTVKAMKTHVNILQAIVNFFLGKKNSA